MAKRAQQPDSLFEAKPLAAPVENLHAALNPEQRAAVEHVGPPLIVLAGPGTGKTRVMAHRVAHLIHARGFSPESILVSTFTIKAAAELRERLHGLVGPQLAERVDARTLHSFGASLVHRHLDRLGLPASVTMIDPAQRRRLVKRVVREEKLFPHAVGEALDSLAARVEKAIEHFANAGVLPDEAVAFARSQRSQHAAAFAEQLADADATAARLALLDDFEACARAYASATRDAWKQGLISFADLTILPIKLLRDDAQARAIVHARLRAVVVDECQDCNPGQIRLLHMLVGATGAGGGKPADVCVVGDDDQAIYAFRGADDRAFDRFARLWPDHRVATLTTNYRSTPDIVKTATHVIARAAHRFRPDKQLVAHAAATATPGVRFVSLRASFDDALTIAAMLHAKRLEAHITHKPWRWSEHAVITRTHTDADRIEAALALEGIPFLRRREPSLLDDAGVQDAIAWMRWLTDPRETWAARRVLTRPPFALDAATSAAWERAYRAAQRQGAIEEAPQSAPAPTFAAFLRSRLDQDASPAATTLRRVLDLHDELAQGLASRRADESVAWLLERTGVAQAELLPARARAARITALVALLKLARSKQWLLDPPGDLAAFVRYFDELCAADPALSFLRDPTSLDATQRTLGAADAGVADQSSAPDAPADGVAITTAHYAKGLEFPVVFVPRVESPHGYPKVGGDAQHDANPWRMPGALVDSLLGATTSAAPRDRKSQQLDEERRVFYVACTRAQRELILLSKYQGKPSKAAANYAQELWRSAEDLRIARRTSDEEVQAALHAGVVLHGAFGQGEEAVPHRIGPRDARTMLAAAVRTMRERAAQALEAAALVRTPTDLRKAEAHMLRATRLSAAIGALERGEPVPDWARDADAADDARLLARLHAALHEPQTPGTPTTDFPPPALPLELSYSSVDAYERCPRCWYARYVLGLREASNAKLTLGGVVHRALDAFYRSWANADAEGSDRPGLDALRREGQRAVASEARTATSDAHLMDLAHDVDTLLTSLFTRLHTPDLHVLETEREITFPYELDGLTHRFIAKIDRIDQARDASLCVVDYKTGLPSKARLTPEPDDLQLGIYALAMRHAFGDDAALGDAAYLFLATGQRASIPMPSLDFASLRARIDAMIRGVAQGKFARNPECTKQECAILTPPSTGPDPS